MTDLRTAAQQALEALEEVQKYGTTTEWFDERVSALCAALADDDGMYGAKALAQAYENGWNAAKAEPVQEPVASLMTHLQSGDMEVAWNDDGFDRELWHEAPLFTAPPQRKPLSEDEILSLFRTAGSPVLFARAIERAHGIGGQP